MAEAQAEARTKGEAPKGQGFGQNEEKEINASRKVFTFCSANEINDANTKFRHIESPLKGGTQRNE
jgi:hypothetical protein